MNFCLQLSFCAYRFDLIYLGPFFPLIQISMCRLSWFMYLLHFVNIIVKKLTIWSVPAVSDFAGPWSVWSWPHLHASSSPLVAAKTNIWILSSAYCWTTQSCMTNYQGRLCPELYAAILGQLWNDHEALRVCSLSCHTLRPHAQELLFKKIIVLFGSDEYDCYTSHYLRGSRLKTVTIFLIHMLDAPLFHFRSIIHTFTFWSFQEHVFYLHFSFPLEHAVGSRLSFYMLYPCFVHMFYMPLPCGLSLFKPVEYCRRTLVCSLLRIPTNTTWLSSRTLTRH